MKAIAISRKWDKQNRQKISHYIIRDYKGNEYTLTQDELKTAIRNNELEMINLTLRKDNKLSVFRKTLNYKIHRGADDISILNMFNYSHIIITYMNFGKIWVLKDSPNEYILHDFDLQVLVRYGITLNIRFDKILVKLESDNHYFGVEFEYEIINNIFKNCIDQELGTARFNDIKRLMNHIVNIPSIAEDIEKRKAEIDKIEYQDLVQIIE